MILPRPRAYIDWSVPKDEAGNDVGVCTENVSYRKYLEWLAEYLFVTDIPVPSSQAAILTAYMNKQEEAASYAVLDLSDMLGYSIWDTESIQEMSASGRPFGELRADEQEAWDELTAEEREEYTEDEFFTSEEDYVRLGAEFSEGKQVPRHISHADIPYRPILATLFKDVSDFKKRYEFLDYFYQNFDECVSK